MRTSIIIFILLQSVSSYCQVRINLAEELVRTSNHVEKPNYGRYFKQADSELELLYTGAFVFYKSFISSQDGSTCSFTPSCSEYAVQSIKKHGMIKGTIKFFDRYTRCNSLSPGFYKIDKKKKRLIDEVGEF